MRKVTVRCFISVQRANLAWFSCATAVKPHRLIHRHACTHLDVQMGLISLIGWGLEIFQLDNAVVPVVSVFVERYDK